MLRVWVDSWQVQCCGEPFAVGDTVRWTLLAQPFDEEVFDAAGRREAVATHVEEHHGGAPEDAPLTEGRVRRVLAVTFEHAPVPGAPRTFAWVPGSGRTQVRWRVDGWESELHPDGTRRFAGYLVDLDVC
jgi:hypothetical protein